jgi:hypothetical protein
MNVLNNLECFIALGLKVCQRHTLQHLAPWAREIPAIPANSAAQTVALSEEGQYKMFSLWCQFISYEENEVL